jgi:ketosteroid isomerase-like protein
MRMLMVSALMLAVGMQAARAADTDEATVREHSSRYTTAILKKDVAALFALLHKDYQGRDLPGLTFRPDGDRRQAIAYWTSDDLSFARFVASVEAVRLFGDTAIETGFFSGTSRERGSNNHYERLRYTRVWVRDGRGWRLAHEQF